MYRCTREEIEKAPTCGGLYLFYSADLDLLYIGKARNLRHRIKQHLFPRGTAEEASNTRKIKHRFHYVCFLPIQEEGDRREVERELIKKMIWCCKGGEQNDLSQMRRAERILQNSRRLLGQVRLLRDS